MSGLTVPRASYRGLRVFALPFDLGGNPGASLGAEALARVLSRRFELLDRGTAPARWRPWAGHTGVELRPYGVEDVFADWASELGRDAEVAIEASVLPVFVGGNHLAVCAAWHALARLMPKVLFVTLDAHHDLGGGTPPGIPRHSDHWLTVFGADPVERVRWAGTRGLPPEGFGDVRSICAREWRERGAAGVVERLGLAGREVVLDIDLDVLDPSVFPALVSREPGGLGWLEVAELIRAVSNTCPVRAIGMSEYNPLLDDRLDTCLDSAFRLLLEALDAALPAAPA